MNDNQYDITDLGRVFVGEVPLTFFLEAFLRIFFIYFLLIISMRLMGNRMSALLTRNEMVAMVVLAAAIGIPVLSPNRGLIPPIIIAVIVVMVERWTASLAFKHQKFENVSQGDVALLVKDGVMRPDEMKHTRISRERLISELRSSGLKHMGNVKRLYFEAGGSFTLILNREGKPGLSIIPDWDKDFHNRQRVHHRVKVCHNCGNSKEENKKQECANCHKSEWISAIGEPEKLKQ